MIGTRLRKESLAIFSYGHNYTGATQARYWRNKGTFELADAYTVKDGFFKDEDMYLFGDGRYLYSSSYYKKACYWLNGTQYFIGTVVNGQKSYAAAGQIVGSNIYMFGHRNLNVGSSLGERACYWLNGTLIWEDPGSDQSNVNHGLVDGSDIYLFGQIKNPNYWYPCYWKNGTLNIMPIDGQEGYGQGGFVDGSNIYVTGFEFDSTYYRSCYWLNGVKTWLGGYGIVHTGAYHGFLKSSDIYVFGFQRGYGSSYSWGCYWKNGVQTTVGNLSDWTICFKGMFYGDDLYLFGASGPSYSTLYPAYWKNRTVQVIGHIGTSYIEGIAWGGFVKHPR